MLLVLFSMLFPINAQSAEVTVNTFEQLQTTITNASEPISIIVDDDITFINAITISNNKDIIIKSSNNNYCFTTTGNFRHFIIETNGVLTLNNIILDCSGFIDSGIEKKGTLILKNAAIINYNGLYAYNSSNIENNVDDNTNKDSTVLDVANLIVGWSGFALAFLTILIGILSFIGFHELRDFQKARNEVAELQKVCENHITKIEELEKSSVKQLSNLTEHFENDAQTIMQATYYFTIGSNAYTESNFYDAINYLKKSLNYIPSNTDCLCLMGRAYTIVGKTDKSNKCFQKALEINPKCAAAYRGLAAWHRHNDKNKALSYARLAADNDPENSEILNYLGQLLRDQNMLADAMKIHLNAYGLQQHPDTDFFLSLLYIAENSFGRAKIHIQDSVTKYNSADEYGRCKPLWKHLAYWASVLILNDADEDSCKNALIQLSEVSKHIDHDRSKTVVLGHIRFLLSAFGKDESYILESESIINNHD